MIVRIACCEGEVSLSMRGLAIRDLARLFAQMESSRDDSLIHDNGSLFALREKVDWRREGSL